ncbi:unnamed protein product [Blepharisma stoltei]|uniref:Uncharacterized protein n=1 Tax=Blepharisma stoltei TaxID=1481888 RepID=A0AAU9JJF6_9CILI|nr:unnamed protein product [Blepharisma stoltei]
MNSLCENCKTNEPATNEDGSTAVLCRSCMEKLRIRSPTRTMSMIVDVPLPDIKSLIENVERMSLDPIGIRLKEEMKKIAKFQKQVISEIEKNAEKMIKELTWQRNQLIQHTKEECISKVLELKALIEAMQGNHIEPTKSRRSSKIMRAPPQLSLIEFHKDVQFIKNNWINLNTISILWTIEGLGTLLESKVINQKVIENYYQNILSQESQFTQQMMLNRKLGDDGARDLSQILPFFANLTTLCFNSNCIGIRGAKFLALGIGHLKKLAKLSINNDKMKEGIVAIIRVLPRLNNMLDLYLNCGTFLEKEAEDVGIALSFAPQLRNLTLIGGLLSEGGMIRISYGLECLSLLSNLDLSGNCIGSGGAKILSEVLLKLTNLRSLKLSSNMLLKEGIAEVSKVIPELPKLEELSLNSNAMEDAGAIELSLGLQLVPNLKILEIQDNEICDVGASRIGQSLQNLQALSLLNASWNPIGNRGATDICAAISQLPEFEKLIMYGIIGSPSLPKNKIPAKYTLYT